MTPQTPRQIFAFTGTVSTDVQPDRIKEEIKRKIAIQQAQFNTGLGDDKEENIDVVEYAYTAAEPNCFMVFARWKII